MHNNNETICIAWCDNGLTDGLFTHSLAKLILNGEQSGIPVGGLLRSSGNQLNRQRMEIIARWFNESPHEWLLFIDSDIIAEISEIKKLWDVADKNTHPIVSGIYYLFNHIYKELPMPKAESSVFRTNNDYKTVESVDIDKENDIFNVDAVGFGLLLLHKSVIAHLITKFTNSTNFFLERTEDGAFIGEDIAFCKYVKQTDLDITVVKSAVVQHMKRFALDKQYADLFVSNDA